MNFPVDWPFVVLCSAIFRLAITHLRRADWRGRAICRIPPVLFARYNLRSRVEVVRSSPAIERNVAA